MGQRSVLMIGKGGCAAFTRVKEAQSSSINLYVSYCQDDAACSYKPSSISLKVVKQIRESRGRLLNNPLLGVEVTRPNSILVEN